MTSICHFCKQETVYVPLDKVSYIKVYFCYACQAEYTHWSKKDEPTFIHLYTMINGNMYRWSTFFINDKQRGLIFYIKDPGIPGIKTNEGVKRIKKFNSDIPTITPDNVNAKLRFMLLFL